MKDTYMIPTGLELGSVSVKLVTLGAGGTPGTTKYLRHEGDFEGVIQGALRDDLERGAVSVTGLAAKSLLDFTYYPESECLETAIRQREMRPDMLLTLGGENVTLYTLQDGEIRDLYSTPKCAAGGGEFLFQQFTRLGLTPEQGIAASRSGRRVPLAARCSVYCKSDATHKLNKGECTPADICRSLIEDLATRIGNLVDSAQWPTRRLLMAGGLALNGPFLGALRSLMAETEITVLPESHVLEAYGAALKTAAAPNGRRNGRSWFKQSETKRTDLRPLREGLPTVDYRAEQARPRMVKDGGRYLLGVDAGSTTTKAVLFDLSDGTVGASSYLRTHGNPVEAVQRCLSELLGAVRSTRIEVVQAAVTGSGRELVAMRLDNCLFFNEILAHGRATAEDFPDIETVFEVGGQDSKFIAFDHGSAVNYAMNDGCSAGTGSFLEESVLIDMGIPLEQIAARAFEGEHPVVFGERCAAFINTDLRNSMQQGASAEDVVAGLIYSIVQNYLVKVVGHRHVGDVIAFQGGVALNKAVAAALALSTGKRVVVPRYPELMGCVGAALMVRDRLKAGALEERSIRLDDLLKQEVQEKPEFKCQSCENSCAIRRVVVRGTAYPFGGLCAKHENVRLRRGSEEGQDLVAARNDMMFNQFGAAEISAPRGTVGIPLALSTYEWFPFFARFFNVLGFRVVTSDEITQRDLRTRAPICYPAEVAHAMVRDLLRRGVDHVLVPYAMGDELPWTPVTGPPLTWEGKLGSGWIDGLFCHLARGVPGLLKISVEKDDVERLLTPMVALSSRMWKGTLGQLMALRRRLCVSQSEIRKAAAVALAHYLEFRRALAATGRRRVHELGKAPTIVLAGRPYVVCSSRINLALPRKIISRGYNVVPIDMLPPVATPPVRRNMWMATQMIENAIAYVAERPNFHLCFVSCFACSPDGMLEPRFRQLVSGRVYCSLELDSHTAHAGFDTRVGAFLDILEQGEAREATGGMHA
jgi:predicted CoA-substrate-specific enzyme activase